jgi:hypothetical protein
MASVSEALGASGAPHELMIDGNVIRFGLITQRVKSDFERWLYQRAVQGVLLAKELAGPLASAMSSSALANIANDLSAGKYAWNGSHMFEAMQTLTGIAQVLSLVSRDKAGKQAAPCEKFEEWLMGKYSSELLNLFGVIFKESLPKKELAPVPETGEQEQALGDPSP